jgi:hypothetical protein
VKVRSLRRPFAREMSLKSQRRIGLECKNNDNSLRIGKEFCSIVMVTDWGEDKMDAEGGAGREKRSLVTKNSN